MIKKPTIGSAQLLLMSVGSALMFPFTFMPILSTPPANQDAWIVLLMTAVYIFAMDVPLLFLMNKFRGMDINEMIETVLGKFFGKVATFIFALITMFCFIACTLMAVIFVSVYIFPQTPTWAVLVYLIVPIAYGAYKGAGTIGRLSMFIVPFIILTIIIFFVLGLGQIDLGELQPVISDSTFFELNQGAFLTASRYSEILIFMVFSLYLKKESSINKTYITAVGVFVICFLLMLIPILTVLGVELAKHTWNPYFVYTRQVGAYDFIQRVQSLNLLSFIPGMMLKLMLYNFMSSYIFARTVKAKSHKRFVIPISVIGFFVCLLPILNKSSTMELLRSDNVFPFIILPATFVLPVIIAIVYFIRRKRIQDLLNQKSISESASP